MTPRQIKNKIDNLDFWLRHNKAHPDYNKVKQQKHNLITKLNTI